MHLKVNQEEAQRLLEAHLPIGTDEVLVVEVDCHMVPPPLDQQRDKKIALIKLIRSVASDFNTGKLHKDESGGLSLLAAKQYIETYFGW